MLPTAKVEAIPVIINSFICCPAEAIVLGIIRVKIFLIPDSLKLKINLYLYPDSIAEGTWIKKCANAPKTAPIAGPYIEYLGAMNIIPKIIKKL